VRAAFTARRPAQDDARMDVERLVREPVRLEDLALRFEATTAATADVHVGGDSFFPAILADVEAATSSVHINQYGFRPGEIGDRFADALLARAAEGVAVRVIVDRVGSRPGGSSRAFYERLRAGGVDVRVMGAPGRIDHRKLFVVDGRVGWVGGAGIEDHFADGRFHDLFVRLTGPVVAQLQLVFVASFRWLGGVVSAEQAAAVFPVAEPGSIPATVLHNAPGSYRPIATAIAELLDGARETLDVINPYVADKAMIRRLAEAARRGVRVRLFVPASPNNKLCGAAQRFHHRDLLDAGVRILGHPAMLHAKAFVRDREQVLAGTCNLEAWSLKRFFEIDVDVRSPELAASFEERFSVPAEAVASALRAPTGAASRIGAAAGAALSPLL
jgi:cardiolipin synthase